VLSFSRTVTEDHTYGGVELKAGDKVFMLYQSANRDEDVFEDADELRVDRSPNPHLAFGIGTHYCLGANLARAEVRVVFEELFKRLADIQVPEGTIPRRGDSALVLSLEHLPAVFTPEPAR
jgi:cytochrome P450